MTMDQFIHEEISPESKQVGQVSVGQQVKITTPLIPLGDEVFRCRVRSGDIRGWVTASSQGQNYFLKRRVYSLEPVAGPDFAALDAMGPKELEEKVNKEDKSIDAQCGFRVAESRKRPATTCSMQKRRKFGPAKGSKYIPRVDQQIAFLRSDRAPEFLIPKTLVFCEVSLLALDLQLCCVSLYNLDLLHLRIQGQAS